MADKRESETIRQQREARKEFLRLKQMQSGEIGTGPKPSDVAIVPRTKKEKIKNIWYHDKWLIIGGFLLTVFLAVMITQCATKPKYDLEVVLYAKTAIMDDSLPEIEKYLEEKCDDLNGDGKVKIQVINCSFNSNSKDTQYTYTMSSKLQAILAADANALLFITDDEGYKYLNSISDSSIFEKEKILLNDKFYKRCDVSKLAKLPENLTISCRAVGNTTVSKDKKFEKFYNASQKILERIKEEK